MKIALSIVALIASIVLHAVVPVYGEPFGGCREPALWGGCSIAPQLAAGALSMLPLVFVGFVVPKMPWIGLGVLFLLSLRGSRRH